MKPAATKARCSLCETSQGRGQLVNTRRSVWKSEEIKAGLLKSGLGQLCLRCCYGQVVKVVGA